MKNLRNYKGESRFRIYTDILKILNGKESLAYICSMNFKKLAKIKAKWRFLGEEDPLKFSILYAIKLIKEKWPWGTNPRATLSTV